MINLELATEGTESTETVFSEGSAGSVAGKEDLSWNS